MWRSYGATDGGICIRFDTVRIISALDDLIENDRLLFYTLLDVTYGTSSETFIERLNGCEDVFQLGSDLIANHFNLEYSPPPETLMRFTILASMAKHPDFTDEREVRIVCIDHPERDKIPNALQVNGSKLLLPLEPCISQIMIGPSSDQDAVHNAVSNVLDECGRSDIEITRSHTPFR